MSAYSPTLMIQTAAAEQTPVPRILMDIIGQPMDYSDPENPVPAVPAHIADYFKNYRDQLPVVESSMPIRVAGDKTIMFPEGYTEEYMFPYMMSDRISRCYREGEAGESGHGEGNLCRNDSFTRSQWACAVSLYCP
jgi:hypothetical protein